MDETTLRILYWNEGMSLRDIAKKFGLKNHKTISYYFNKFNISRRNAKQYTKNTIIMKPQIKKDISEGLKKYYQSHIHPVFGMKYSEEVKKKISKNTINMLKNGKIGKCDTSIERKVENQLLFNNILYVKQFKYEHGVADFWLPESNVIIECDGDYWHALPRVQERNILQTKWLNDNGYITLRLKESDINNNFTSCLEAINNEL